MTKNRISVQRADMDVGFELRLQVKAKEVARLAYNVYRAVARVEQPGVMRPCDWEQRPEAERAEAAVRVREYRAQPQWGARDAYEAWRKFQPSPQPPPFDKLSPDERLREYLLWAVAHELTVSVC